MLSSEHRTRKRWSASYTSCNGHIEYCLFTSVSLYTPDYPVDSRVFCGDWFFDQSTELFWSILNFGLFAGLCIALYFLKRRSLRWCFGISVFALCFAGGWLGITCQLKQTVYDFPEKEAVYRVRLTDTPETKERTLLCRVLLKELRDSSGYVR